MGPAEALAVAGARDTAILATLRVGGLRRAELAGLTIDDYRPGDPPLLTVRRGKGDKGRELPLNAAAGAALDRWLALRGPAPGALFTRIDRWGHVDRRMRPLSTQAVYTILEKRAGEAVVADLSPHDFRRTFVGDLLEAGVDLATVQQLAGHADPATTARYDRRGRATKARATAKLAFPDWSGRGRPGGDGRTEGEA